MQDLETWLTSAVVALSLVVAGWIAWQRSRIEEQPTPRFLRVFYSSAAFAFTMALVLGASEAANRGLSWQAAPLMAMAIVVFVAIGMILFGIADFWLNLFRPSLTRSWLAIAISVFGLFLCLCFVIAFLIAGETGDLLQPDVLQVIGVGVVAGTVWWSFLPAPKRNTAHLFE